MAEELQLNATIRTDTGKRSSARLVEEGKVPAVIYGHGNPAQPLTVDLAEFKRIINHSGLMELNVESDKAHSVFINEIQFHPVTDIPIHIDFQEVNKFEAITTLIPVNFEGTPKGAVEGGELDQVIYEIELTCPAANMPESITVDVSEMELNDTLSISDLKLPEKATTTLDAEEVIFSLRLEEMEEPEAEAEEELAEGPEVITKGKQEEEEEAEA